MKAKILSIIVKVVSEATEVSPNVIFSKNKTEDAVEARTMVMHIAKMYGLCNCYLQKKFDRKSRESITHLQDLHYILERSSFVYRETIKQVTNEISSILKVT